MEAGPLNLRIWLQTSVDGKSLGGVPEEQYTDWLECWAAIEPLTSREIIAAQAVNSDINVRIRIRRRDGIDATVRVRWQHGPGSPPQQDYFDIIGPPIEPLTNATEMWLMCKRRDSQGFRTGVP